MCSGKKNPGGSQSEPRNALPSIQTASAGLLQSVRVKYSERHTFKPTTKGYLQHPEPKCILPPSTLGFNSFFFGSFAETATSYYYLTLYRV